MTAGTYSKSKNTTSFHTKQPPRPPRIELTHSCLENTRTHARTHALAPPFMIRSSLTAPFFPSSRICLIHSLPHFPDSVSEIRRCGSVRVGRALAPVIPKMADLTSRVDSQTKHESFIHIATRGIAVYACAPFLSIQRDLRFTECATVSGLSPPASSQHGRFPCLRANKTLRNEHASTQCPTSRTVKYLPL